MRATMMDYPLTLTHYLERAGTLLGESEIVTRLPDKSLHRYRYGDFCRRARQLASALARAGLKRGEAVATMMWNNYPHEEAYFGVPCAGGVLHTLNFRLHPNDIAYIANHAGDRFVIVDDVLLPLFEKVRPEIAPERVFVAALSGQPVPKATRATRTCWRAAILTTTCPHSTRAMPAASATPRAPPGGPRGSSTRTAPWCSTPWRCA